MHFTRGSKQSQERDLVQAGFCFALSLTNHPEEAEDLVQQACFRVIAKKGQLHSRSYLFKAIRNLFYDHERRKKIIAFEPIEDSPSLSASNPTPCVTMDLESELNKLPSEEREVLYLNCVEGYTAAELATMLGKPRSTVLNILSRAKNKLFDKGSKPTERRRCE